MSQAEERRSQDRGDEFCTGCHCFVDRDGHSDDCDGAEVIDISEQALRPGPEGNGAGVDVSQLTALAETAQDLEAENQALRERVDELEERLDAASRNRQALEESIHDIEKRLDAGRKKRESMKSLLVRKEISDQDREFIHNNGSILDQLRLEGRDAPLQQIKAQLEDEQKMRSRSIALLRKEFENLVSELDVDFDDEEVIEDDKIARVRKVGLEDLVDGRITASEERAEQLLQDLDEVGDVGRAPIGLRIRISSPEAREYFAEHHDEDLNSVQVRRVFEQIEEWGGASPRSVTVRKSDGTNTLHLGLRDQEEV